MKVTTPPKRRTLREVAAIRASRLLTAWAIALLSGCSDHKETSYVCDAPPSRPASLVAAGSGANIPLFAALAGMYHRDQGEVVLVPESIGTSGAVRALHDGAIDLGLSSRALLREEQALGLRQIPFAKTALGVAVHRDTSVGELDIRTIGKLFSGDLRRWKDGTPVIPIQREEGDSGWQILSRVQPDLFSQIMRGRSQPHQRFCYTDTEVFEVLGRTTGAIGIVDEGSARLLGDASGWEPIPGATRTLYLLLPSRPDQRVVDFRRYLQTNETAAFLRRMGYIPLQQGG